MAKNGTRCRPCYEDQDARISILANDLVSKGRIRFRRLLRTSDTNRLPTGRAIRFLVQFEREFSGLAPPAGTSHSCLSPLSCNASRPHRCHKRGFSTVSNGCDTGSKAAFNGRGPESCLSPNHQLLPFSGEMCGKPGRKYDCATNGCFSTWQVNRLSLNRGMAGRGHEAAHRVRVG